MAEHLNLLRDKPLHGQFLQEISNKVWSNSQWTWLRKSNFTKELEGLAFAAQEQALSSNSIKAHIYKLPSSSICRLCGMVDETVDHLISSYSYFKGRHDAIASLIHWTLLKLAGVQAQTPFIIIIIIKTHGSVSCGPRSRRATPVSILTGKTKTSFSHLCISVITYPIGTKFATQLPASQRSLHSKFEGNRSSHFQDTSCQSLVFFPHFFSSFLSFRTLAKIAITSKRVLRSP